jgi:hypothetical protein
MNLLSGSDDLDKLWAQSSNQYGGGFANQQNKGGFVPMVGLNNFNQQQQPPSNFGGAPFGMQQ